MLLAFLADSHKVGIATAQFVLRRIDVDLEPRMDIRSPGWNFRSDEPGLSPFLIEVGAAMPRALVRRENDG